MIRLIFFVALYWSLGAGAASAEIVSASIAAIVGWVSSLSSVGLALLQVAAGTALSAIQKAKARKAAGAHGGIQTEFTLDGGENSESFILGRYATAGSWVCPPLTRGARNRTLTYVVDLGGIAGQQLVGLYVDSELVEFDGDFDHGQTRNAAGDTYADKVRVTYYDGSQTEASALLLEHYADHPDFPWSADMVGRGRCFVVVEFEFDNKLWGGHPKVLFDVEGVPVFDPRTGGAAYSDNLSVLAYNVKRGFAFADGTRWGGDVDAEDLPLSVWAAAMNECDRQIALVGGGTEKQFRGGIEVRVDVDEPAEIIERFMDACGGDVAEEGGSWYIQVGAPALPSMFITDGDLIVERPTEMDPFPGLNSTVNGLTMRFPNPAKAWAVSEAERALRADLEAKDGGRRLLESLNLIACPFERQVQRVGQAYVDDSRRFLTHKLALPPDAAKLPPLSTISWDSEYNQYDGKLFQIEDKGVSPYDLLTSLQVRETDPSDFSWSVQDELPSSGGVTQISPPELYVIDGVEVLPEVIRDSAGNPRRAAILVRGLDPELEGVEWRIQDHSAAVISRGVAMNAGAEFLLTEGVLPAQDYLVGLRASGGGFVDWSAWFAVTTHNVRFGVPDFAQEVLDEVSKNAELSLARLGYRIDGLAESSALAMARARAEEIRQGERLTTATFELKRSIDEQGSAYAQSILDLKAVSEATVSLVNEEKTARISADEAQAQSIASLGAQIGGVSASIVGETTARVNGDQVNASALSAYIASNDAALAAAASDISVLATENSAQASSISSLIASFGGLSTSVSQHATAIANTEGKLTAALLFRTKAGTSGAELELVSANDPQNGAASAARLKASNILLDGSVEAGHVNVQSFATSGLALFGGDLRSANFSAGNAGWRIKANGEAEFNKLIARSSLVVGAISDGSSISEYVSGPGQRTNGQVSSVVNLGAWTLDNIWHIGCHLRYRGAGVWYDTPRSHGQDDEMRQYLQVLYTIPRLEYQFIPAGSGAWSSWIAIETLPSTTSNSWQIASLGRTLVGDFTDVRVRIHFTVGRQGGIGYLTSGFKSSGYHYQSNVYKMSVAGKSVIT